MPDDASQQKIEWKFMLPLILGTMMNPLNSTMLATALITLCNSFNISIGQGAILITSLYVTSTIAQPLMGRLADIYSAKKINTLGFILVMAAALIGIIAPSFGWLIVSRIVLGFGTSAAYPSAMALINKKYAEADQPVPGNILGIVAISSQVSMVLGPTLGGVLTQFLGWRGIFFVNIPWVVIAVILSRAIPDYPVVKDQFNTSIFKKLDIPGILLFSLFLLSLLFLLLTNDITWYSILVVLVLFAAMFNWEWKHDSPFIDVKLLVNKPALSLVYLRTFATSYILYLLLYAMPQWIEGVRHVLPAKTGLIMLPTSVMAITLGYLISKYNKPVFQNVLGVFVMIAACFTMLLLNANTSIITVLMFTVVIGSADGINMIANQSLLNREAPLAQKGVSFGLYRTAGYIGAIISSVQLKKLFRNGVTDHSFHHIGFFAISSSFLLLILLWPLVIKKETLKLKPL